MVLVFPVLTGRHGPPSAVGRAPLRCGAAQCSCKVIPFILVWRLVVRSSGGGGVGTEGRLWLHFDGSGCTGRRVTRPVLWSGVADRLTACYVGRSSG